MGTIKGPYKEEFSGGSVVRIVNLPSHSLEKFLNAWKLHNSLEPHQLGYADRTAVVESVSLYHGGDELYRLVGIPGIWHEQRLREAK
jgi:hypothetical protein